ncbi:MAG: transcriptional regulator GcvA [Gammaproteobacteria bacterium]|nr:transcriptional regulator GcvA [Gammaproteobacteria bacterium]
MARSLPPLNLLRTFEVAARHLSFTLAAAELHVTQAAISQQIKQLEDALGTALFLRAHRKLRLTDQGRQLLPVLQTSFHQIADTITALRATKGRQTLTIGLGTSFGSWLAPRLERFWTIHPDVDLRLHHSRRLINFVEDDIELAIRWGRGDWPNVVAEPLMGLTLTPVCSPALLAGARPLRTPDDLRHHTLLHDTDYESWRQWLIAANINANEVEKICRGSVFDDTNVVTQAALDGQGVALCGIALVTSHLASGRLLQPFDLTVDTDSQYYVLYPPMALKRPLVNDFIRWLHLETGSDAARPADEPRNKN